MAKIIKIPPVVRESRIGQVFNDLFNVISQTECTSPFEDIIWEFGQSKFFHPFFICGLSLYKQRCERIIKINAPISYISKYLDLIYFDNPITVNDVCDIKKVVGYLDKSYIPICKFPNNAEVVDVITAELQKIIRQQCIHELSVNSALSYLIGELAGNIQDHSKSQFGYMFSQYLSREGCINLCLADEGLTIHGSFVRSGRFPTSELIDEGAVLNLALGYASTKNLPKAENRGFGLPTSKKMLAEGLRGGFFIFSGNAFHRHDTNGVKTATLPESIKWDGTIILLKIPVKAPKNFNYLNYVER